MSKCVHERLYRDKRGVCFKIESLSVGDDNASVEWITLTDILIVPKDRYEDVLIILCDDKAFQVREHIAGSLEDLMSRLGMSIPKAKAIVAAKQQALNDIRKLDSVDDLLKGLEDNETSEDEE